MPDLEYLRNVLNQQLLIIFFFSYFNLLYPTERLGFLLFPSFCSWQNGLDFTYIKFSNYYLHSLTKSLCKLGSGNQEPLISILNREESRIFQIFLTLQAG